MHRAEKDVTTGAEEVAGVDEYATDSHRRPVGGRENPGGGDLRGKAPYWATARNISRSADGGAAQDYAGGGGKGGGLPAGVVGVDDEVGGSALLQPGQAQVLAGRPGTGRQRRLGRDAGGVHRLDLLRDQAVREDAA